VDTRPVRRMPLRTRIVATLAERFGAELRGG